MLSSYGFVCTLFFFHFVLKLTNTHSENDKKMETKHIHKQAKLFYITQNNFTQRKRSRKTHKPWNCFIILYIYIYISPTHASYEHHCVYFYTECCQCLLSSVYLISSDKKKHRLHPRYTCIIRLNEHSKIKFCGDNRNLHYNKWHCLHDNIKCIYSNTILNMRGYFYVVLLFTFYLLIMMIQWYNVLL